MAKKVIVLSLGGSLIVPNKIHVELLEEFKKILLKNSKKYKFVVVCGGGIIARTYINGLKNQKIHNKKYLQSLLGVSATRTNARFMTNFFGKDANKGIPHEIKEVHSSIIKNNIVFCGALRYAKDQTSDTTAATLARYFHSDFINLTNVQGLYDKNPKKFKSAKFISEISFNNFYSIAKKIKFTPGQNFVLDQKAAKIIQKYKIRTYILGPNMNNLDNLLNHKHFVGTLIDSKHKIK
ncbi:MAG: UMP kinase [archaeon]